MTEDRRQKTEMLSRLCRVFGLSFDKTTDETTSHLTKPLKRQVIGYSHSTRLPKNDNQVAGYRLKNASQVAGYVLCLLSSIPAFAASFGSVQASYDVYKGGMKVGQIEETYVRDKGSYTLSSTTTPIGLLAIFKPEKVFITSSGLIGKQGLQPLHFIHQRERDKSKESRAEFDWGSKQLTLAHQAQRTVVALPDGTQDRLSAMYQFMFLPLRSATTLDFPMTNGNKLDSYHYTIVRNQTLKLPAGEFKTLYLDNQAKPGESRTEIWLATQHNNLPCKMIITDASGDQLTQVLSKLQIR